MNNSRVSLKFMRIPWFDLVHFAMYISLLLFANPLFASPPFTKAEFDAAILDLQKKGEAAMNPKHVGTEVRDEKLEVVLSMLRKLASFVNIKSNGNSIIILLSGFKAIKFTNHNVKSNFKVIRGKKSGQVFAKWGSVYGAHSYVVRYSINEDGLRDVFTDISIGKVSLTINNLLKGKEYIFQMAVVYSDYQGDFCNPVFLVSL